MPQSGFTPLQIYSSSTASNVPSASNLVNSTQGAELAINIADGKLFYKDSGGTVQVLATKGGVGSSTTTQVLYNSSGLVVGSANLTFNGTTLTVNTLNLTNALTTSYGGTGLTSFTAGDLPYYSTGTALSKLAIGTNGYILQSNGSAPTWVIASSVIGGAGGSNTQVQYNSSGSLAGSANMTFSGTALTLANDASISGLTVGKGGGAVATNTVIGASAGGVNTTGSQNAFFGGNSGLANTTGQDNQFIGYYAGRGNTTGNYSVAIGTLALGSASNNSGNNIGIGYYALSVNTGGNNTAIGSQALQANTTASNNTAVGYQAGYSATGGLITAVGYKSGFSTTSGNPNLFLGYQAGYSNTTGSSNSIVGSSNTFYYNTTGSNNTAFGDSALYNNTTASNNTAVGYQAAYSQSTSSLGGFGVYIGASAGYSSTGFGNTFVGGNGATGFGAGYSMTSGANNSIFGGYSGNQGGLDIRTASNYIVLSDGAGNPKFYLGGTTAFFRTDTGTARGLQTDASQTYPSADNTMSLGLASFRWSVVYAATALINTSDANLKQDIAELDDAEKRVAIRIKSLIKKYRFKDSVAEKGDSARIHIGVIAQEVQAAFTAEGLDSAQYALFCSDTWYVIDGKRSEVADEPFTQDTPNAVAVTQLGIRYDELLAFVISTL